MTNTDKSLLLHYNVDSQGNPTAIKIENESKQASSINYCVQLQQVPDEQHRMVVVDDLGNELIEVYNMDEIKENNYYINYTSSVVWFHPSKAGKTFIFSYFGMGLELIGASRIYDETTYVGEFIIRTIQEIIDKGRECIEALSTVGNAVQVLHRLEEDIATGTILHNNLLQDIATGNQLVIDLNNTIEIGTQLDTDLGVTINTANTSKTNLETTTTNANDKKVELEGTISTANTSKTNLENATATADAKKTELDTSIANAQDDINTINAKGNDSYIVLSTNWVGTEPNLTYTLNHGLNSKNLIVGAINDDTKFSSMPDFKYIDMNTIELQSTTRSNITVSINANYYSGKDANTVAQELIDARGGEVNLKSKINGIDTSINALNNEIITARGSDLTLDERLDGIDLDVNKNANKLDYIPMLSNIVTTPKNIRYIGHRGASLLMPENSIPSYEMAGKLGLWGAECDITTTSDGVWVLMHDDTVDRTTNGTGTVSSLTLSQIKALKIDVGSNISMYPNLKVPTLDEYLAICKKFNIVPVIEIKSATNISDYDTLVNQIKKYGYEENCVIISFSLTALQEVRKRSKKIIMQYLADINTTTINDVKLLGNCGIDVYSPNITKELVELAHSNGIMVNVWVINNYQDVKIMMNYGVDFITTDIITGGVI